MHHQMALNINYIENFSWRIYLQNWLRYGYSEFRFCLLRSAIMLLARDTKLWKVTVQVISYFSAIDTLVAEIRHSEVGLLVSSALHSTGCQHTQLVYSCVFTRIVLTAKRSYNRTPRLFPNVLCTRRNFFQLVWQPKNASFFRTWRETAHFRSPSFPARVTL